MKRRTLLKLFPSMGLALFGAGSAVADYPTDPARPPNQPDEEFLRLICERIRQQYEESVGVDRLDAFVRVKVDTNTVLVGDGNPFDKKEIDLGMNFFWGDDAAGSYAGVGIFVSYTWIHGPSVSVHWHVGGQDHHGKTLCEGNDNYHSKKEPLPEDLGEALSFILEQVVLSPAMVDKILRGWSAEGNDGS